MTGSNDHIASAREQHGFALMYVCLCLGITTEAVHDAVNNGACTSRQVAAACGAGSQCGRCRRTVRAIIASHADNEAAPKHHLWSRVRQLSGHH